VSIAVTVANTGITGSYAGRICIVACASTSGTLRSDGRLSGVLFIEGVVNASWKLYLATGAVRVDINRDGDYEDVGDIVIGSATSDDDTAPTMSQPSNITVTAAIGSRGDVRVYYDPPVATDNGVDLPVLCTPVSGSLFGVGTTTVTCRATDQSGNVRTRPITVTVVASTFVSAPVVSGGATVIIEAGGFQPNSSVVVTVFSDPTFVGVFETDSEGRIRIELPLPEGLPEGSHDVVVSGLAPGGGPMQFVQPLVVSSTGELPDTGGDGGASAILPPALWLALIGFAMTIVARRPRRASGSRAE
jgi:hypothetical protein